MFEGISINCACFKGYSLETALQSISELGYKYVELAGMKDYCEFVSPLMKDEAVSYVKHLLKLNQLQVSALSAHVDYLADPESLQWLEKSIPLATKLGANIVITAPGEGDYDHRLETLNSLDSICRVYGVTLALEPHGSLCSGSLLQEAIDKANTSNVKINYDIANVGFFGGYNPLDDLAPLTHLAYVHLKDHIGGKGIWNFPAAGKGELPLPKIINLLKDKGYQGYLSAEIEFTPDGPDSFEHIRDSARISFEYITNLIK